MQGAYIIQNIRSVLKNGGTVFCTYSEVHHGTE